LPLVTILLTLVMSLAFLAQPGYTHPIVTATESIPAEDAKADDAFAGRAFDQWMQRAANNEIGERLRRVERARRFTCRATPLQDDSVSSGSGEGGLVVQHALVDGAELFDTKISIVDACSMCRGCRW